MITAKDILESETFKGAVERVRSRLVDAFERADPQDVAGLQNAAYSREALSSIIRELQRELHKPSINLKGKTK